MKVKVTERADIREQDRLAGINAVIRKHGKIKIPNCYVCSAAKSDKYVKCQRLEIDYLPESYDVVFKVKCHGDEIHLREKITSVLNKENIDLRMVFKPGQGIREDGVLKYTIPSRHKLDTTYAY